MDAKNPFISTVDNKEYQQPKCKIPLVCSVPSSSHNTLPENSKRKICKQAQNKCKVLPDYK